MKEMIAENEAKVRDLEDAIRVLEDKSKKDNDEWETKLNQAEGDQEAFRKFRQDEQKMIQEKEQLAQDLEDEKKGRQAEVRDLEK